MAEQDFDIKIRTTADTAGAKQTEAQLKRLETEAAQAGANIGRLIAPFLSGFSAFKFVDQINIVAERLKQTSAELARQGEQLMENAQRYQELAKEARSEADVIKIGSSALKDVEQAHRRVLAVQQEELTWWDKLTDAVYHQIQVAGTAGTAAEDAGRIAKNALDLRIEGHERLAEIARQDLIGAIRTGEAYKEAFDRRKAEPFEQALKTLNDQLKEQQQLLAATDYTVNPESWLAISKTIERIKGDLAEINKLKKGAEGELDKAMRGASPQVKNILMNEQAAAAAATAGRSREADLFTKSAAAFMRGATPGQMAEYQNIKGMQQQSDPTTHDLLRQLLDMWR